jgi:hypothetical protein
MAKHRDRQAGWVRNLYPRRPRKLGEHGHQADAGRTIDPNSAEGREIAARVLGKNAEKGDFSPV